METIFTKIINGEIPAYKIAENEKFLAFLDAMPLVEGHTLVIPKKPTDKIFDIESEDFKELFGFAQQVAKKIEKAIVCKRVGLAVVGLEVPHAHIHLIPLNKMDDMNFKNVRLKFSKDEYERTKNLIKNA
ncbi:histidine triad (HIT) family protein [Halpernia humi]|uniref:Histidine triad (HIT) family protein n=1 Tax=Halpernia humi TaxID=493375 RepID=A0A1H5WX82_9FLAO|nr:HIT domain-containing protein [Halpernia humi]SEG03597.1 histidine triad (HIT) family protein [Halpernia humi]